MNAIQFRNSIDDLYARLIALTATKGEEYKRREDNQFANFDRAAAELGMTREQVLMVYLAKHYNSIITFVRDSASGLTFNYAEPITGRIDDAILYLLLLRGMVSGRTDGLPEAVEDLTATDVPPHPVQVTLPGVPEAGGKWPKVCLSSVHTDAVEWCRANGYVPGTSALAAPDQMHGIRPPTIVVFLHHGTAADDSMYREVCDRATKQSLAVELVKL